MGYDVHITKAADWVDSSENPITLEEWLSFVENDPEMRHDGYAEAESPDGDMIRYENEGLSVWIRYTKHRYDGGMAWFDYGEGNITVKNPDSEILAKMYKIAQEFGAIVQGDEGEIYDANGQSNCQETKDSIVTKKKPWWKLW